MQTETNREIVQILYAHGHSTYHPVLAQALEDYFEGKIQKLKDEQEALDAVNGTDPLPMLYKLLNNAAAKGDTDVIDVASKAIQRITF